MTKVFYRDAVGALLVFDVTNINSFISLKKIWIPQLNEFGCTGMRKILVGNKQDINDRGFENYVEMAKALASEEGVYINYYFEYLFSIF